LGRVVGKPVEAATGTDCPVTLCGPEGASTRTGYLYLY